MATPPVSFCSWSYELTRCCIPGVRSESGAQLSPQGSKPPS
jgi:hypothetical protein